MKQSDRNDNRHKRRAALLLALVMLLPACGDDDDDDEAGGATEVADSAVDEPATAGGSQTTAAASDQSTTTVAPLSTELGDLPELPVPEDQIDTEATVRFSVAIVEQQLDPHKVTQSFNDHIFYDSVFQLDKDLNVMPGIGTGFTLSDDQKSIDVTIRDDATFADGTAVDAAAVKASLDRARTLPESVVKGRLAGITEITVVDPQTLRLELSEPDATLIFVLATNAGMVINPKALTDGTDLGTATAGSTPYDLAEYVPGEKFVAVRRDGFDYWDPAAWKIKRIEFHQVTDQTAAVNGLQTDVFDSIRLTLPTDAAQQQIGPAFNYVLPPANSMRALMLRDTQPALQDPTIRQAIAHAIDDEAIATSVLNRCDFSGGQLVRAGDPAYIEGYEAFPYDPDKARELLAGRTPSFELLVASTQPEENNWAQVAQQQLADVGISTTITPFSLADATAQFQGKSRDAYFQGSTGQADLALTVSFFFFGPNALAGTPELQDALRQGIATANALPLGSPERAEALQELHRVALESAVYIPACHLSQYYASDKNLVGMDDTEFGYSGSFSVRYLVWTK